MRFAAPLALAWAVSVPILVWLWRFATSRHETRIPSIAPFAHLLRRPPTKRTRLFVNLLFWLQLAALACLTAGAAQPMLVGPRVRNVLLIVDTSASMGARQPGASAFEQAKGYLQSRMVNPLRAERVMLVTTAPLLALTPEPVSDRSQLINLIDQLRVADAGGHLAVARRLGQALMGSAPDETVVVTDEPAPAQSEPHITFRSFGRALPNVAIVGAESYEPLCQSFEPSAGASPMPSGGPLPSADQSHIVVAVQNFFDRPQAVQATVRAQGGGQTRAAIEVPAGAQVPMTLEVPPQAVGTLEVWLEAAHDALDVDNRMRLTRRPSSISVLVAARRQPFTDAMGRWLQACSGLQWSQASPNELRATADVLITDDPLAAAAWPSAALIIAPPDSQTRVRLSSWWLDPAHPLSNYLQPLERVAATEADISPSLEASEPVVWAIRNGQRVPLAWGSEYGGRRSVTLAVDPTAAPAPGPMLVLVLNSLRWLTAATELRDVNFLDPVESNTWTRASTWDADERVASPPAREASAARFSLTSACLIAVLGLLLMEWWRYSRKGARG